MHDLEQCALAACMFDTKSTPWLIECHLLQADPFDCCMYLTVIACTVQQATIQTEEHPAYLRIRDIAMSNWQSCQARLVSQLYTCL